MKPNSATHIVASALGVAAGLLGLEHGCFEALQGGAAPDALLISAIGPPCDPATAWHACEPAFTIVPDFLVTGVLAMVVAGALLIWAAAFVQRPRGGAVLLLLTIVLFLVGGGFFTLWYGVVAGIAGVRIGAPLSWWRAHAATRTVRVLARLSPWVLIAYLVWDVASWFLGAAFGEFMARLSLGVTAATPVVLALIILSGFADDVTTSTETS